MKIRIFQVILTIVTAHTIGAAQVSGSAHLNFELPIAHGEYRNISDNTVGAGGRLLLYLRPAPNIPVEPGISIGIFGRGRSSERYTVEIPPGIYEDYKVNASNSVANFGFALKIDPLRQGVARPYVEGEIGGNVFFSNINVVREDDGKTQTVNDPEATKGRWASYMGGSAGIKLALGSEDNVAYGLDLRCGYFVGSNVKYNAKPTIDNDLNVTFERLESKTNMLIPQIGFWVSFGKGVGEKEKAPVRDFPGTRRH